jgi:hypothetical protein
MPPRSTTDQLRLDVAETITVYVIGPDGRLLDLIDDVDLGNPTEAHRNGRISLKAACLWAYIATSRYRQIRLRADGA